MPIHLIKVTARRDRNKITTVSREIIDTLPDDPHYYDPLCDLLLKKMVRDGVIPDPQREGEMVSVPGPPDPAA